MKTMPGATADALVKLQYEIDRLDPEIMKLGNEIAKGETYRDGLRVRREQTREMEQRRVRLASSGSITNVSTSWKPGSRPAARRRRCCQAAADAEQQAIHTKREHQAMLTDYSRFQLERRDAQTALERATRGAEEVPVLEHRLAALGLNEVIGFMKPRPKLVRDLAESERRQTDQAASSQSLAKNARRPSAKRHPRKKRNAKRRGRSRR
jgi:hypothetical protein